MAEEEVRRRSASDPAPSIEPGPQAAGPAEDADGQRPPRIDGFDLGGVLGRGGFATVWEATRIYGGERVAVKVAQAAGEEITERFRREAAAMRALGAPFTAALHASGQLEDGRPYLIMERLRGETLDAFLGPRQRPPELASVARIGDGILAALAAAHQAGLVHRDLKPANVFLVSGGDRVALLDFGLVKLTSRHQADLTRSDVAVGTLEYMAPEQLRGERALDERTDVYAFGVLLYEMLTLAPPFTGTPAAIEHGHLLLRPRRPSELAKVPRALSDLVLACLSKDPARRPASVEALAWSFAEALRAPHQPEVPPSDARAPQSAKLIAEGRSPVVVAVVECHGTPAPVAAVVTARGGFVARQQGARYLAIFSGLDAEVPAHAAIAAARELVHLHRVRVALHLAEVTLRRRERGLPTVYGAPVDRPETWLPPEPWSGIVCTPELSRALPEDALALDRTTLAPTAELHIQDTPLHLYTRAPLLGREPIAGTIAASARAVYADGTPALFTLIGDSGLGKTRLAEESVSLARAAGAHAKVIFLGAHPPGAGERHGLALQLWQALSGAPGAELGARRHHQTAQALTQALRARATEGPTAVILDGAEFADAAVLDALEHATLDGEGCPLWVMVAAHPRFLEQRAGWGTRTRRAERVTLAPLDPQAAAELAGKLLAPAEYPPAELLARLAGFCGGNPASLVEIVQALKRAGMVQRRPGASAYYVASAELEGLPPSPSWQWLAARRLAALPPDIAACLRLCAVLGSACSREELEGVQTALEERGGASSPVDAGVGLAALADEGLLARTDGERYAFTNALFHDAVYESIEPAQRTEVHRAALSHWRRAASDDAAEEALERIARHTAAAGEREEAAATHLRLGEMAAARHRHVEADQRYSTALAAAPEGDARGRALALGGRGKSRLHLDRAREAVSDFAEARALAAAIGDRTLLAELLLEEATAEDWAGENGISAARAHEAHPIVVELGSPVLAARLAVADGRTAMRRGELTESIRLLDLGVAAAVEAGDYSSRVIGLLLLAWQLSCAGRLDEAEARFAEVVTLTEAAGDLLHLCVAHVNRQQLWLMRHDPARAIADLQRAIELTRELGNPLLERVGCANVAELLYSSGRTAEALDLARRGLMLEQRFVERRESWLPAVLARIHLERGESEEAARLVAWIDEAQPFDLVDDSEVKLPRQRSIQLVKLVLSELSGRSDLQRDWDEAVVAAAASAEVDDLLEVLLWRARAALRRGAESEAARAVELAQRHLAEAPLWRARFDALDTSPRQLAEP